MAYLFFDLEGELLGRSTSNCLENGKGFAREKKRAIVIVSDVTKQLIQISPGGRTAELRPKHRRIILAALAETEGWNGQDL